MFKTMAMNYPFNESVSLDGAKGIWWFAVTVYVVLIVLWVPKVIFHRDMIRREYNHPSRFYFCLAPHLALLMIGIGMPADYAAESNGLLKTIWLICAFLQCAFANTTYSRWMQPHTHAQKHSGDWPEWAATRVPSFRFGKSSHGGGGVGGEGVDDGVEVEDEGTGVWDGAVVSGDDHGQVSIPHDPPRDHVEKVPDQSLQHASPPYLLSTVGWLLLTVLGQQLSLHGEWGLDLPMYTFGCGVVFYTLVVSVPAAYSAFASKAARPPRPPHPHTHAPHVPRLPFPKLPPFRAAGVHHADVEHARDHCIARTHNDHRASISGVHLHKEHGRPFRQLAEGMLLRHCAMHAKQSICWITRVLSSRKWMGCVA